MFDSCNKYPMMGGGEKDARNILNDSQFFFRVSKEYVL